MRISDWSSDVCSSDLADNASMMLRDTVAACVLASNGSGSTPASRRSSSKAARMSDRISTFHADTDATKAPTRVSRIGRSEEHTSELQSLMRISYAVFCLKKQKKNTITNIRR